MKLLVISDNHGDEYALNEIHALYDREIDLWIHCGDSEFHELNPHWTSFDTVQGNMDISDEFPTERVKSFDNFKVLLVHGHLHDVKYSFETLKKRAQEEEASVVFYGHTHVPAVDHIEDIYFINPGSISQPRGRLQIGTYAIIETDNGQGEINFYDADHNRVEELHQKINIDN